MGGLQTGGGTSAVAASAHAGCERFRRTDSFITGRSRKALAEHLMFADLGAGIPEARWMRAMTFESLVHSERFVSELLTKTVGQLGLERPKAIRRVRCGGSVPATAKALKDAHLKASFADEATMITALGVPYLHLEERATPTQPDFAIVAPRHQRQRAVGSWLIMGDAKDYERVRSRIDDGRMLKGFLQVALGAESAAAWSQLPKGMLVHRFGALAVPRNAFLQPEAVVEDLTDHCTEVRLRAEERIAIKEALGENKPTEDELAEYVGHLRATFDPRSCVTCNLFKYCRHELRSSSEPADLLTEIGIERALHGALAGLVIGTGEVGDTAPATTIAQVVATLTGAPSWTGRPRIDPVFSPGTVNVVLAKADSAALGVHGIAVQRVGRGGAELWVRRTYLDPQSPSTRRSIMDLIGRAIRSSHDEGVSPVHLVVPDRPTADLLVTAADSLAGVELSRLRWQRDLDEGRTPLTFDGDQATVPEPLGEDERLAVSFLLEEDRARAMTMRTPIVELRAVLASHLVPGGPAPDAGRLDYLVTWAEASETEPLDHRATSDGIAEQVETPGARLSNTASDAIHLARKRNDEDTYRQLVNDALTYRIGVVERAIAVLEDLPVSRLREVHSILEADAQVVWGRRLALQASDLVRFSRTFRFWRNDQVEMLDADAKCHAQLASIGDGSTAHDRAADPGVRELALATVVGIDPIRLQVRSRRLCDGAVVVALHINDEALVERPSTTLKIQGGSFKLGQMPLGRLTDDGGDGLVWEPKVPPALEVGDRLVVADVRWFGKPFRSGHEIAVARPAVDARVAPKATCTPTSYDADPVEHQWCCKPHRVSEAEIADRLAERRARGELNPQAWPPLVDEERFDVGVPEAPELADVPPVPTDLTLDDLDGEG